MPDDLRAQIDTAKQHGYSDKEITDFLSQNKPELAGKIKLAQSHNYEPEQIVSFLSSAQLSPSASVSRPSLAMPKPLDLGGPQPKTPAPPPRGTSMGDPRAAYYGERFRQEKTKQAEEGGYFGSGFAKAATELSRVKPTGFDWRTGDVKFAPTEKEVAPGVHEATEPAQELARATHTSFEAAMELGTPLMLAGLAVAPIPTVQALVIGAGLKYGANYGLQAAGVKPEYAEVLSDALSILGASKSEKITDVGKNLARSGIDYFESDPHKLAFKALRQFGKRADALENLKTSMPEVAATGVEIKGLDDLLDTRQPDGSMREGAITKAKKKNREQYRMMQGPAYEAGSKIDGNKIADEMEATINSKMIRENPGKAKDILARAKQYRESIHLEEAEELLKTTNAELESYYGKNPSARYKTEAGDPDVALLKAQAESLRTAIYEKLDAPGQGSAARELQRRYGTLMELAMAAERRRNATLAQAHNIFGENIGKWASILEAGKGVVKIIGSGGKFGWGNLLEAGGMRGATEYIKRSNTTDALLRRAFRRYKLRPEPVDLPLVPIPDPSDPNKVIFVPRQWSTFQTGAASQYDPQAGVTKFKAGVEAEETKRLAKEKAKSDHEEAQRQIKETILEGKKVDAESLLASKKAVAQTREEKQKLEQKKQEDLRVQAEQQEEKTGKRKGKKGRTVLPSPKKLVGLEPTQESSAFGDVATGSTGGKIQPTIDPSTPLGPGEMYVRTPNGTIARVRNSIVELDTLDNSFSGGEAFPEHLQPRNTARFDDPERVREREGDMDYTMMAESAVAGDGAPITVKGADGRLKAATRNAGSEALKRLSDPNHPNHALYTKYKADLAAAASKYGMTSEQVMGMKNPVHVREMLEAWDNESMNEFAKQANRSSVAGQSSAEQAAELAGYITPERMENLRPDSEGKPNIEFVNDLFKVLPNNLIKTFRTSKGTLSTAGEAVVQAAIFARAYRTQSVLETMSEATDSPIKNITRGMSKAGAHFIKTSIQAANNDAMKAADIAEKVGSAAEIVQSIRGRMTIKHYLLQGDLTGPPRDPVVESIIAMFDEHRNSYKRIGDVLIEYNELLQERSKQLNLMGEIEIPTPEELLEIANGRVRRAAAEQAGSGEVDPVVSEEEESVEAGSAGKAGGGVPSGLEGTPGGGSAELAPASSGGGSSQENASQSSNQAPLKPGEQLPGPATALPNVAAPAPAPSQSTPGVPEELYQQVVAGIRERAKTPKVKLSARNIQDHIFVQSRHKTKVDKATATAILTRLEKEGIIGPANQHGVHPIVRAGEPATPLPATDVGKASYTDRMKQAKDANEGRALFREAESEIEALQRSMGLEPTVGQIKPYDWRGASVINQPEWAKAFKAADKVDPTKGKRLRELVADLKTARKAWEPLYAHEYEEPAEPEPTTPAPKQRFAKRPRFVKRPKDGGPEPETPLPKKKLTTEGETPAPEPGATPAKVQPAPTQHTVTFFTGSHGPGVGEAAKRRGDIGLMVTPLKPDYLARATDYPVIAIDNGVFSKVQEFDAGKFTKLYEKAASDPEIRKRVRFVVAPDVIGDAGKTIDQFGPWADKIHAAGLPVAFVAQDGLEKVPEQIPWDKMDVLFIGGSTEWKIGEGIEDERGWINIFREANRRGIPIHIGRVNSGERLHLAEYGLGASSVDGTYLAFGPKKNLPNVETWLNRQNKRDDLSSKGVKVKQDDRMPKTGRPGDISSLVPATRLPEPETPPPPELVRSYNGYYA